MTDANLGFGTVAEVSRMLAFSGQIPPLVVVGVGYGGLSGTGVPMTLRNYELTPTVDQAYLDRASGEGRPVGPMGLGGASGFLKFIEEELAPVIEETYGGDSSDRGLLGFSLGGLFTTWAMLQPSTTFRRFIAGSPSLWWDNRVMFREEEKRARGPKQLSARVFLSAGELEERPEGPDTSAFRMVSNVIEFAGALGRRQYEGLSVQLGLIRDAGHEQAPMLIQGLKAVYGGHR